MANGPAIWQGSALLLGFLGWIWQAGLTTPVIILLATGAGALAVWIIVAPRDFADFVSGRQVRYSSIAVFSTLLLVGIVVLVYILLARSALTLDMTEGRHFYPQPRIAGRAGQTGSPNSHHRLL